MKNYGKRIYSLNFNYSEKEYRRYVKKFQMIYRRFLPKDINSQIIDLGCGAGHFLYFLNSLGYKKISGVDISEDQIEQARRKVNANLFSAGVFEFLNSDKNQYDLIVCNHLIEHFSIEEFEKLIKIMLERLSANGKIIITTPNGSSIWAGYSFFSDITHKHLYTAESFLGLLYDLPVNLDFFEEGSAPYDIPSTLRWLLWKTRLVYLKILFLIDVGPWRNKSKPMIFSSNLICIIKKNQ